MTGLVHYLLAIALAATLLSSASLVSEGERALSRLETPEEKTDTLVKDWAERLSFGLYSDASEKAEARARLEDEAGYHRERVWACSVALAVLSGGFLAWLALSLRGGGAAARHRLTLHVHGVAAVCLVVGLAAPMLVWRHRAAGEEHQAKRYASCSYDIQDSV